MKNVQIEDDKIIGEYRLPCDGCATLADDDPKYLEYVSSLEKAESNLSIKKDLSLIDEKSIRSIREYLIKKFGDDPDFPIFLSDHENDAKAKRNEFK